MDLFSAAGVAAWQRRINASPRFAQAARAWSGRLLLVEREDGAARTAWVVVHDGQCTEARIGTPADDADADFVLEASPTTWRELITAKSTPAVAALRGHLSLLKGNMLALLPHASAAAELLAAAAEGSL